MMTRDFVYVKDVAHAIVLALLHKEGRENNGMGGKGIPTTNGGGGEVPTFNVYNIFTGVSITINELATRVKSSMGLEEEKKEEEVKGKEGY
jgi:nucleoside-diphosphate-sugar epimerase